MEWHDHNKLAKTLQELEKSLPRGSKRREEVKEERLEQERFAQQSYAIYEMTPREDQGR